MILHQSRFVRVNYRPGASKFLLVTFGPRGLYPSGEIFWGDNFAAKASIAMVGFTATGPDWYPARYMDEAIEAANRVSADFDSVIVYGGSMGGYGALKFSARLRATRTIAFSPQYSISPLDLGRPDKRYIRNYVPELHDRMGIEGQDIAARSYVFSDPYLHLDLHHTRLIQAASPLITAIPVYLTGHVPIFTFTGTAIGQTLFQAVLSDDIETLHRLALRRRNFPKIRTPEAVRLLLKRGSTARAYTLLQTRRSDFSPKSLRQYYYGLMRECLKQGQLDLYDRVAGHALGFFPAGDPLITQLAQKRIKQTSPMNAI
jgi:pimeloyl-ACP methyl ester carboxylesterase